MIALASSLRVYLACGVTDMRKGMTGLAMLVRQTLAEDPFGGAVFAFRGRRAGLAAGATRTPHRPSACSFRLRSSGQLHGTFRAEPCGPQGEGPGAGAGACGDPYRTG